MEESILTSTKKVLQIGPDDESFDLDVITHINSAFSTLNDIGVGPEDGFTIEDDSTEWSAFTTDTVQLSKVKTYVFLKVRILFDPPATSFHLTALERQLDEHLWRLNVNRETTEWVDPDPPVVFVEDEI